MAYLQQMATGEYMALSQKLLNELGAGWETAVISGYEMA